MNFHIMTLFPEMITGSLSNSITGRASDKGYISFNAVNIRDYSNDIKHHKVDDYTYGGGAGMLMQAQPIYDCFISIKDEILKRGGKSPRVIYVTPQGAVFNQKMAQEFAAEEDLVFLCGHYEGVDERVLEEIVTDYVSIGDYVLTGGELPAMVMIDAISRLVPGVLNNDESAMTESFNNNLLEYPQYSRPEEWMGKKVPAILLSGDHKKVDEWRLEKSIERTMERRPDLYEKYLAENPPKPPKKKRRRRKADPEISSEQVTGDKTINTENGE
ncbi:tRNA (guanosine(37)-N1)-methyltransferase TrmD [Butyrivibrio sp. XBB1001]|uniref:tRNA (guanosine(37)-N1)-methyltransferase TrmD n=1 Tax=Butyrivibrio sp. XBB1001 TaxID=1280682 RepID=UPI00047DC76C|nr:tRNA (guanosine(37)-N1)-methyltransferase TrmD [Butyrivibrio sp. XBB1001]